MANIYRDGYKVPDLLSAMKFSYLIGYRQESVQVYHDSMNLNISFGKQEERKKIPMRGMNRGF